jgi:hypothetical protein
MTGDAELRLTMHGYTERDGVVAQSGVRLEVILPPAGARQFAIRLLEEAEHADRLYERINRPDEGA